MRRFNIPAMMLTLTMGMVLGALTSRNVPNTSAATDEPVVTVAEAANPAEVPAKPHAHHPETTNYLGVVFARQSADIVARSEGTLEAIDVNLGDRVMAGDVIAGTHSYSGNQQLEMAEATLLSVQADQRTVELELKDAEFRYHRRQELAKLGLISQEDFVSSRIQFDRADARLQAARARVSEQEARVSDAKETLANAIIRAPFDGTVAARYLDPGAAVQVGTPIISLIRLDDLWVRFAVPELALRRVSVGSAVNFQLQGSPARISAEIEYLAPSVTAAGQEFLAEARLNLAASQRNQVKPGTSVLVSLQAR